METSWKAVSKGAIGTSKTMWGQLCVRRLQGRNSQGFGSPGLPCPLSTAGPKPGCSILQLESPCWQQGQRGLGTAIWIQPHTLEMVHFVFFFNLLQILSLVFFSLYSFDLFFYPKRSYFLMVLHLVRYLFYYIFARSFLGKRKDFLAPSICVKITWSYGF